jgi:hypothetical protein
MTASAPDAGIAINVPSPWYKVWRESLLDLRSQGELKRLSMAATTMWTQGSLHVHVVTDEGDVPFLSMIDNRFHTSNEFTHSKCSSS